MQDEPDKRAGTDLKSDWLVGASWGACPPSCAICHRTVMVAAPTRNRRVGREVHVGSSPTDGAIIY